MKDLLGGGLRWRLSLRLMLLQSVWNYERLQNLGWAFCMEPALKRLYPDPAARAAALRRHLENFNTHPYMAGYVLGAALRAESEVAQGRLPGSAVSSLKSGLAPALAAMGDAFFWAALRPAAAVLGFAWLWLAPEHWRWAAPLVFLGAYNLPGLWLRLHSLEVGYRRGADVAAHVAGLGLPALAEGLRRAALVLGLSLAGLLAWVRHPALPENESASQVPLAGEALFLGSGLLMLLLLRLSVRPPVLMLICAALAQLLALALHLQA